MQTKRPSRASIIQKDAHKAVYMDTERMNQMLRYMISPPHLTQHPEAQPRNRRMTALFIILPTLSLLAGAAVAAVQYGAL